MPFRNIATLAMLAVLRVAAASDAVPVTVQPIGDVLIDREIDAPATVLSNNRSDVTSQITALVDEIVADVGEQVARGDILVRLDAADARLALQQAQADLAALDAQMVEARRRLARAEELLQRDFVSDDELESRRTAVTVLEANRKRQRVLVDQARLALSRTEIRAPFAATVVARQAQVGSLARPGSPLITIVQSTDREVDAEIDPADTATLRGAADLRFESQGKTWAVSLLRLSDVVEADTRKQRARFAFKADPALIGTSGHIVWTDDSALVPVSLIVQREDQFGVFVDENGRARFVAIPSAQEGRPARIDLPKDTRIVSRGHVRLQDGDELQVASE